MNTWPGSVALISVAMSGLMVNLKYRPANNGASKENQSQTVRKI